MRSCKSTQKATKHLVARSLDYHWQFGISRLVALQFFVELLRAPRVRVPAQDLSMDMSQLPASWRGGLRVTFG